MVPSDFIDHLTRKGVLREAAMPRAAPPRRGAAADVDWLGLTKLTQSTFADELAVFYGCNRVQRSDLVGARFAGQMMSSRFLRDRRLFPFENRSGTLALAIAAPTEGETVRAVELALRRPVAIAVATGDDIDAALATMLDGEKSSAAAPPMWRSRRTIWTICATSRAVHRWCARSTTCFGSRSSNVPPTCTSSPSATRCRCAFGSTGCSETSRRRR